MKFNAVDVALKTVEYINKGGYLNHTFNKDIYIARLYTPAQLRDLCVRIVDATPNAKISLYNQDTCECAKRFINIGSTGVLNFASARNIGGGFLNGAMAQEEAICRNSTLYASISSESARIYYEYNRTKELELYSDHIIYSPCVEVIRDGNGNLIDTPYTISVITSPAVNVHRARQSTKEDIDKCMLQRAEYILKVAVDNHLNNLILGAWGCGVFGNSPENIAQMFRHLLFEKEYIKAFKNVSFAVYGRNLRNYQAFEDVFGAFL